MNVQVGFYLLLLVISVISVSSLGLYAFRRKAIPGASPFVLMVVCALIWVVSYGMEIFSVDYSAKLSWLNIRQIGVLFMPLTWLTLAWEHNRQEKWQQWSILGLLCVIPTLTLIFDWTSGYHEIIRQEIYPIAYGEVTLLATRRGPWFGVSAAYGYVLLLMSVWFFVDTLRLARNHYREQTLVLLISMLLLLLGSVMDVFQFNPVAPFNPAVLTSSPALLIAAWGLFRHRLFDLIPVARDKVIESMHVGVVIADAQDRIIDYNPAAKQVLEAAQGSSGSFAGKPVSEVLGLRVDQTAQLPQSGVQTEFVLGQGEDQRIYETHCSPIQDARGQPAGKVFLLRDITTRRHAEHQAMQLALEREHVRILSNFIQNASHEFRTPLSSILTNIYLIERAADADRRHQQAQVIREQVKRMTRLLDMLGTMTKLDSGLPLNSKPTDLNDLLLWIASEMRPGLESKGLSLRLDLDEALPAFRADPDMMQEAFEQLIDNAARYTPPGGEIRVRSWGEGDCATIEVHDTGPGIPQDILPRIFERFYRLDEAHTLPGFGLGLPIAQKIIEGHGGHIEVESEAGQGSTFRIVLPLEEETPN